MDCSSWIKKELIFSMIDHGCFGKRKNDIEVANCNVTSQAMGDDHFTSSTYFINLELNLKEALPQTHHMLLKLCPKDEAFKLYMRSDMQFHTETWMYTQVIPSLHEFVQNRGISVIKQLFPKCYYARKDQEENLIVLQDMRPLGFKVCEQRVFLDYAHCCLALKKLGMFHAASYAMKKLEPTKYHSILSNLKNSFFGSTNFYSITTSRAIDYIDKHRLADETVTERLRNCLKNGDKLREQLLKPKEPLSVLCHGDVCRNNMLFSYNEAGEPSEVMFFDLQTSRYASPAIDLTFFIYLNTTSELRAQHFDDLFQEYHGSLLTTLTDILQCPVDSLLPEYSIDNFYKEFVDHGLYGFLLCSFFLPEMLVGPDIKLDYALAARLTLEDLSCMYIKLGGEQETARVADIVQDLIARNAF